MDYSSFNFISIEPKDKLVFRHSASRSDPAFANVNFSINHTITAQFVPIIRYTVDGTTWYYNGDGKSVAGGQREIQLRADATNTAVRVTGFTGPSAVSYTYEIYGIAKNV